MSKSKSLSSQLLIESLAARLTDATYREALRRGVHGSFLDFELALWRQVRETIQRELRSERAPAAVDGEVQLAAEVA